MRTLYCISSGQITMCQKWSEVMGLERDLPGFICCCRAPGHGSDAGGFTGLMFFDWPVKPIGFLVLINGRLADPSVKHTVQSDNSTVGCICETQSGIQGGLLEQALPILETGQWCRRASQS